MIAIRQVLSYNLLFIVVQIDRYILTRLLMPLQNISTICLYVCFHQAQYAVLFQIHAIKQNKEVILPNLIYF